MDSSAAGAIAATLIQPPSRSIDQARQLLELEIPFAERGEGYGGRRGSEAKVEMKLVDPAGAILVHGVGFGRPKNVVTSPERVAGNVVERLLEKAFGRR